MTVERADACKEDAGGEPVLYLSAHFYRLRDGLIVQQRQFFDSFDVLQQVMEVDLADVLAQRRR